VNITGTFDLFIELKVSKEVLEEVNTPIEVLDYINIYLFSKYIHVLVIKYY